MGARSKTDRRRSSGSAGLSQRPTARRLALEVFLAWDSSNDSADRLFAGHPGLGRLSARDRDLAAELIRGTFRWRGRLDWRLIPLCNRPLSDIEPALLWILRLGLYQLEGLDRIPAHAAVDTSVELAKEFAASGGAGGFVNAVLRQSGRVEPLPEPDASVDPVAHLEARTSHPAWLLDRWLKRFGFGRTLKLAAANNEKPSLTLRVTSDRVDPEDLAADLRSHGMVVETGEYLPGALRLPGGWHVALREILESGVAVVQDEAAGLVAHVSRPAGGLKVLDLCAAPGGKALHFADLCGDALVVASDVSRRRIRRLQETIERTNVTGVFPIVADGSCPMTRGGFARVLVDAPCSNTGVLRRRPDARWRRTEEDVHRLATLQGELMDAGRKQVGPGGLLVYSTCSLEPEENEDVVRAYLERHPGDALVPASEVMPEELVQGECLVTHPADHGVDGAFAAVIRPAGSSLRVIQ